MFPPVCSALLRLRVHEYIFTGLNIAGVHGNVKDKVYFCSLLCVGLGEGGCGKEKNIDRIYKIDRMDTRNHDHVHPVKLAR